MATETPVSVPDGGMRVFIEGRVVANGEDSIRVLVRNEGDRAFRIGVLEIVSAAGTGISGALLLETDLPVEKLLQPGEEQIYTVVLAYSGDGGFTVEVRIPASPFTDGYYSCTLNGQIAYSAPVAAIPDLDVELIFVLGQAAPNTSVADGGSIDLTSGGFGAINTLAGPPPQTTWRLHNLGSGDLTITGIAFVGTTGTGSFPTPNTLPDFSSASPAPSFPLVIPAGGFSDIDVDYNNDANGTAPDDTMSIDSDDPDEDPYNFGMPAEFTQAI